MRKRVRIKHTDTSQRFAGAAGWATPSSAWFGGWCVVLDGEDPETQSMWFSDAEVEILPE